MIKVIAFDLVGVLVRKNDVDLTKEKIRLEKIFDVYNNPISEEEYLLRIDNIKSATLDIFNKLYEIINPKLFFYLKKKYPNIKLVIASNYDSSILNYLKTTFNPDSIYLSSLVHFAKPNKEYYNYLLKKEKIKPEELLFLDDKDNNILNASFLGVNTIKVNNNTNIIKEIEKYVV